MIFSGVLHRQDLSGRHTSRMWVRPAPASVIAAGMRGPTQRAQDALHRVPAAKTSTKTHTYAARRPARTAPPPRRPAPPCRGLMCRDVPAARYCHSPLRCSTILCNFQDDVNADRACNRRRQSGSHLVTARMARTAAGQNSHRARREPRRVDARSRTSIPGVGLSRPRHRQQQTPAGLPPIRSARGTARTRNRRSARAPRSPTACYSIDAALGRIAPASGRSCSQQKLAVRLSAPRDRAAVGSHDARVMQQNASCP